MRRRRSRMRAQAIEQHEQRRRFPRRAPTIGGERIECVTRRPPDRDERADDAERGDADDTDRRPAPGERAEHEPEQADHDQHADAQRDLVVRAELLDREVLQPHRRAIDELGSDGVARRLHVAEQAGDEVADAECERGREQPGERGAKPSRPRSRLGSSGEGRCGHAGSTERRLRSDVGATPCTGFGRTMIRQWRNQALLRYRVLPRR